MVPDSSPTDLDAQRLAHVQALLQNGDGLARADLAGVTLTGEDLRAYEALDFQGADLRGARFVNADLGEAKFGEADLSGASFQNVNLARANFARCSGRGATFADVNLAYASFREADLRGSLFFDANMADISFKGASLDGSEVEAIRLSLNGSTHVLGLKESICSLAGPISYPFIAGVSGDAFWLTYYLKTQDINWGGFAKDSMMRGLRNFGFACELLDEVEEDDAWERLAGALAEGKTVITPLHVSAATVLGSGFGGAEWVFVTGIDRGEVLVNCLLGDGLRFTPDRFRAGWCVHHPLEEAADDLPVIYAMCVVEAREETPGRAEIVRRGLAGAIEVLSLPPTDKVLFGFDAYTQLVEDLESNDDPAEMPPDEARRYLPWLGLGLLHHHGSRWAIRDFLGEVRDAGDLTGTDRDALIEAHELYQATCDDLQRVLETLPWTFDVHDEDERAEAIRTLHQNRGAAADLLRSAAAKERDALVRFRAIVEPG
ncbi:MAG: pentapeptide repeat-containing protein [Planctomycetota bacterium]